MKKQKSNYKRHKQIKICNKNTGKRLGILIKIFKVKNY